MMGKLVIAVGILFYSWMHPVHVSLLNVDLDAKTGKIEIAFKLFSDDLENILLNRYNVGLEITDTVDPGEKTDVMHRYIDETFKFSVNGTKIEKWKFVGHQINEEAIWLYYTNQWPGEMQQITITNEILMDLYEDQINLVIVNWSDTQNGYSLNNKNREISFILE